MSNLSDKYSIAFEESNPGGTTIIKVVSKLNSKIAIGFAVYDNSSTGRVTACDGENGMVLIELLHFLQDEKEDITWHLVS